MGIWATNLLHRFSDAMQLCCALEVGTFFLKILLRIAIVAILSSITPLSNSQTSNKHFELRLVQANDPRNHCIEILHPQYSPRSFWRGKLWWGQKWAAGERERGRRSRACNRVTSRDSLKCWRACPRAIRHQIFSTWIFGLIGKYANTEVWVRLSLSYFLIRSCTAQDSSRWSFNDTNNWCRLSIETHPLWARFVIQQSLPTTMI